MDSDISSSDDDEDIYDFLMWERRPYKILPRPDYFNVYDDTDFFTRFRLQKQTVLYILTLIEDKIESKTDRNHSVSPIHKLLLTLRFYALGSMLISVADFSGVSKSSASSIIEEVSLAIAQLAPQFIQMPQGRDMISERMEFYKKAALPRVIGALDCTHVKILSPGGCYAENFRNRKGYFSLNVQTISSANLRILDIVARWPGSVHDQTIFNNSRIRHRLLSGEFRDSIIVADSGYANTRYIMTPLLRTRTPAEEVFNEAVIRTRNPVERSYGVWKRRFPVISLGLRLKMKTIQTVIIATAVLHNIALTMDSGVPSTEIEVDIEEWDPLEPLEESNGNLLPTARDDLLLHFSNFTL